MKHSPFLIVLLCLFSFYGCKKSDVVSTSAKNTVYWEGLIFGQHHFGTEPPYFSTIDTSFKTPLTEAEVKALGKIDKIDLVYIYNNDSWAPGFMDAHTMTQHWYWDDYYTPWLSTANSTQFFLTRLDRTHFDSAKADASKFNIYFSDTSKVYLAPHTVFPRGTCIGGRNFCASAADCAVNDISLLRGHVYGFISNNKKGFIYIQEDQSQCPGWPAPVLNFETKVDIVKEK